LNRSHVSLFLVLSAGLVLLAAFSCGKKNRAPDVPAITAGPDSCFKDTTHAFSAVAADPDGDSVSVRFDWGDSNVSNWSGWVASGDTAASTHAWSDTGTFEVKVQARDTGLRTSSWSSGLAVRVVIARPAPDAPTAPSGPVKGWQDSSYTFGIFVPFSETIAVAIRFAWGDGAISDWSSFAAPGDSVKRSHTWSVPDTYAVAAQAKDTANTLSQWSAPHNIRIKPPDTLRLWRVKLTAIEERSFYSSPAFGPNGSIYVGSPDGGLYSLRDSMVQWRYQTGDEIRSSPAIAPDGTIYVGSYDDTLYALDPGGTPRWGVPTGHHVHASPAIGSDGTVYFGSLDHWLYAVNPDGSVKWRTSNVNATRSSPAVAADGVVYVGSNDDSIYAVNANGTVKWGYETGGIIRSSPSFGADGTVYCGSHDGCLYALNPDRTLKWKYQTGGVVQSSAVVATDGAIYFGSDDSNLYALDAGGTRKWKYQTGGGVTASPAIAADGTVYFGSADYSIYALNPDGSAKWQFDTDGAIQSSPTIGPDGKVYFTSSDGYLYALKGKSPLASSPWPKFHHDLRNTGRAQ
jgi:outer membrane protein assembly factor BamB